MKPFLMLVAVSMLLHHSSAAQAACDVSFQAHVEVAGGEFSLADLLASDACPSFKQPAALVPLGTAPLAGSARVLRGDDVRALFTLVQQRAASAAPWKVGRIPERIVIRRKGSQASCREIAARLIAMLGSNQPTETAQLSLKPARESVSEKGAPEMTFAERKEETDCGAAGRISEKATVEPMRTVWDPALRQWKIWARCGDPSDCVPFLMEASSGDEPSLRGRSLGLSSIANVGAASTALSRETTGHLLVHTGQAVTLIWDQGGIRAVVPAVSLDGGEPGDGVRARIARGGRIIRAIVVSAGIVRTAA
jgi:hypothetical protein